MALHVARSWNGVAPNPISYSDIAAWSHLMRTPVTNWEVELLRSLDLVWLSKPKNAVRDDA